MEPLPATRRAILGAGACLAAAPSAGAGAASADVAESDVMNILERYHGFGDKASGGPGDNASGEWLEGELKAAGYACLRQPIEVPAYEGERPSLTCGPARVSLLPQAIVVPSPGVSGPLHIAGTPAPPADGIALVVLPHARWSTAKGEVERRVRAALAAGAAGAVVVTTGPTGEALALNAPADEPLFDRPVAVLAPKDAGPFLQAALRGETATLRIPGRSVRRAAFNVTATLDRGAAKSLVISTPRSGWFGCAGERGPGVAVFLLLARWAARERLPANVALVATSGHEYENAGGERFIHELAPKPPETALWVHLGANVAARDWHERGPALSPLPSPDPQRFLLASPALVASARSAFAGQPGLEQVYTAHPARAAGELGNILRAGYAPAIGVFGAHRYHHAQDDDLRCIEPDLVPPVAQAFIQIIRSVLAAS